MHNQDAFAILPSTTLNATWNSAQLQADYYNAAYLVVVTSAIGAGQGITHIVQIPHPYSWESGWIDVATAPAHSVETTYVHFFGYGAAEGVSTGTDIVSKVECVIPKLWRVRMELTNSEDITVAAYVVPCII